MRPASTIVRVIALSATLWGCSDSVAPGGGPPPVDAEPDTLPDAAPDAAPDMADAEAAAACVRCEGDDDCPGDAICHPIGYCFAACASDDDCADGFTCGDDDRCRPDAGVCIGCDDPGAADDVCNGFDDDCDGNIDEDFAPDTCGVGACAATSRCEDGIVVACADQMGSPAPDDSGCDGIDDDCDGTADEDYAAIGCGDGPCGSESRCEDGLEVACAPDPARAAGDDATCDGIDDDCDGAVDEGYALHECGVGLCLAASRCVAGEETCDPAEAADDDTTCDGLDDDCDGRADEAFVSVDVCGLGECVAPSTCAGGALSCAPLEPPFPGVDQNCDDLDEDCDGEVDEDCLDNSVGFGLVNDAEDQVDVDLIFEQSGPGGTPNARFFMPRLIELVVVLPPSLTWFDSMAYTVERGPAAVAAEKLLQALPDGDNRLRITLLSVRNSERIEPGVIAHLHLQRVGGGGPPYRFEFDERLSALAPEEANDRLLFTTADLEP